MARCSRAAREALAGEREASMKVPAISIPGLSWFAGECLPQD